MNHLDSGVTVTLVLIETCASLTRSWSSTDREAAAPQQRSHMLLDICNLTFLCSGHAWQANKLTLLRTSVPAPRPLLVSMARSASCIA